MKWFQGLPGSARGKLVAGSTPEVSMKTLFLPALLALLLGACDKKTPPEAERGAAPPPIQSSQPGACRSGGGSVADKVSAGFFPRTAGDYCLDPNGEARAYGEEAPAHIDKVCTELFDGECETYKQFGLERVVTLRYIDGKGSPGAVNVNLSRFATKEGAFAFFSKRVIAEADPLESAPAKLEAGGVGAIGTGIAYVWRGEHVAELSYTNELESPDQLKQSAPKAIVPIAKQIGDKLGGDKQPPSAVLGLPAASRLEMGVAFSTSDALGIKGLGGAAVGYYKEGDKRWRVLSLVRPDEDAAKDVMKTLGKQLGAKPLKGTTFDGVRFEQRADDSSPKVVWVAGRKGERVFAIGDEEHVLGTDKPADVVAKVSLSEEDKLTRLKQLVEPPKAP